MKKKYIYLEIGNRLKELRNNLSQKEFSTRIDVPIATYQRYEYGETLPPGPVLSRIAELCGKTVDWLLGRDLESVITGEEKENVVKESPTIYNEGKNLDALVEKVAKIYKEGDLSERAMVRGMIDEIYDKMIEKILARLKKEDPPVKKTNNAG